jgi:hypothetical protein
MGEPGSSRAKYNRFAGVERSAGDTARQTHCWVLRERERLLGPDSSGRAILTLYPLGPMRIPVGGAPGMEPARMLRTA